MTYVLDGVAASLIRSAEWFSIPYDEHIRSAREMPWWWVTLTGLQKRWDSLQERTPMDFEKMAIPKDYRVFMQTKWVDEWVADRERQAKEAREKKEKDS